MIDQITIQKTEGQTVITLNRPDRANALTGSMLRALTQAVQDAASDSVIVLTGAGRVFSAGADLDHLSDGLATDPAWEDLSGAIAGHRGLTVALLNGTTAGGAMGMVLACDLRICVPGAKFFYPVLANKVDPQPSDPGRLAALVGASRAAEFFLLGGKVTADQALAWGMVNAVVESKDFQTWMQDKLELPRTVGLSAIDRIKSKF